MVWRHESWRQKRQVWRAVTGPRSMWMHRNCLVVCLGRVGRLSPLYVLKSCSRLADLIEEL